RSNWWRQIRSALRAIKSVCCGRRKRSSSTTTFTDPGAKKNRPGLLFAGPSEPRAKSYPKRQRTASPRLASPCRPRSSSSDRSISASLDVICLGGMAKLGLTRNIINSSSHNRRAMIDIRNTRVERPRLHDPAMANGSVVFLMYHELEVPDRSLCRPEPGYVRYVLTEADFRSQILWLRQARWHGLSVSEALAFT